MSLLPARLRPAAPFAQLPQFAPPAQANAPGPCLATQQLEPGVQLRWRPRPRRPVGCAEVGAEVGASPACGWFDSSRELSQGLEVRECEARALPTADPDAGLEVSVLDRGSLTGPAQRPGGAL